MKLIDLFEKDVNRTIETVVKADDQDHILDEVVEYLATNKGIKMEIQGHTDNKGSAEYNMKLSYKRADSVRRYIVGKGIAPERLKVNGFGFSKPVVPNDSDENRTRNRRVEFKPI